MENTRCSAQVIYDRWCHTHQCEKKAKVTRNGKPYCTVHDPEYIAKKDTERSAKYANESAREKARWELETTTVSACKAINPDNPMAVANSISDLYEASKLVLEATMFDNNLPNDRSNWQIIRNKVNEAVNKANSK